MRVLSQSVSEKLLAVSGSDAVWQFFSLVELGCVGFGSIIHPAELLKQRSGGGGILACVCSRTAQRTTRNDETRRRDKEMGVSTGAISSRRCSSYSRVCNGDRGGSSRVDVVDAVDALPSLSDCGGSASRLPLQSRMLLMLLQP